jgi:hypothetical protein
MYAPAMIRARIFSPSSGSVMIGQSFNIGYSYYNKRGFASTLHAQP